LPDINPVFKFEAPPPLSLYVHFPWCARKCPYCDFNSHAVQGALPETEYVDALLRDLEQQLPAVWGRTVQSIFMGGGTPSLFSPQAINRLLSGIRARLPLQPALEITLETNPGSAEQEKFAAYRQAGVNRLSIGIQSLNDTHLKALGRIHDSQQALRAARSARQAGFENFNLDLMFGLPQQSVAQAIEDLRTVIALQPAHLSWYQLTLEPNTLFYAQPPALPEDDRKAEMQDLGQSLLAKHGYTQYEVSAYAKAGKHCCHNLNYWKFGDYIGIGAGAHGKITSAAEGVIHRIWKWRHPKQYLASAGTKQGIDGQHKLTESEALFEFALNRLRLKQGFSFCEFEASCGLERSWIRPIVQQAQNDGLLALDGDRVQHTGQGWRYLNNLLERFLPRESLSDPHL
jgi:oxygen-independent coproporphyrinogen-3 oxidase